MDISTYSTIGRQTGLLKELQVIANNVANASTTGFRQEGMIFSEYVQALEGAPSISMSNGNVRNTSFLQGTMAQTGGTFDFAIEGEGFFMVETADGERFTRAGSFTPNEFGELVNPDGNRLLDTGGGAIFVPPDASSVAVGSDGTLSVGGVPQNQIGVFRPNDETAVFREDGVRFRFEGGSEAVENPSVFQGFLEGSNVNPVSQITRMIEVQRSYELGQGFLDREHERLQNLMQTLSR